MAMQGNSSAQQQQTNAALLFAAPCRANEVQFQQFVRGLAAVMNQWTALHLVAQHCDPNAFQNLYEDVVAWHQRDGEVYSDELEIFFEDFFGTARSVVIEDDSMKEVADVLHDMYCNCCSDDFSRVEHFVGTEVIYRRDNPVAMCVNGGGNEEGAGELTTGIDTGDGADAYEGDEDNDNEEEREGEAMQQRQQAAKSQKKKNASKKSGGGWNVVL